MTSSQSSRLRSLDVLRGLTICFMIIVNNPGSWSHVYPPLLHAEWNGYTPTDLVFPFFLFIVGAAIGLGSSKLKAMGSKEAWKKIVKRTAIIFGLGLFLNLFPSFDFENVRILGVLQRIALAYFVAALLVYYLSPRNVVLAALGILLSYWGILYLVPADQALTLEGNLVRILDLELLGEQHLYGGYGLPFDPEGLLSTWTSIASVLIGFVVTLGLKRRDLIIKKLKLLLVLGIGFMVLGMIWNMVFPINKPIWSSSYVLVTSAWACFIWALLIFLIDMKGWESWSKPFMHFGKNPLFIYVLSAFYVICISGILKVSNTAGNELSIYAYMYQDWYRPVLGDLNGSLAFALSQALLFWIVAFLLDRKNIVIKV